MPPQRALQNNLRRALRGLAAVLLALGLTGCSNSPYPHGEADRPILYLAQGDDPKTLDPSIAYDAGSYAVVGLLYPSYFQYHYLKRDPLVLEPALGAAEPMRRPAAVTVTHGGKPRTVMGESWTFRIKRGLRFQDDPCFPGGHGREITGADFLYSFRRMADPAIICPIVQYFGDKIVGMAAYQEHNQARERRGQPPDYDWPVAGLQTDPHDPYVFRLLLNQSYPQLRFLMAMPFTSPLAHEAVARYGPDLARHPVGCGPFVLAEYTPKGRIVLNVNPNRRDEYYPSDGAPGDREAGLLRDAGQRLPLVQQVQFNTVRESVTSWNLFQQGYLDLGGVSQENFQQVLSHANQLSPEMKRRGIRLSRGVGLSTDYFLFNMDDPVYGGYTPQRRKLRQAIATALDSQSFIDLLSQGMGRPAQSLISPGLFGYDAGYKNPYRQYSVARAKQFLAEAGYPGGVDPKTGQRLALYFDNNATDATGRQRVGLVTKQLEAIGLDLQPRSWRDTVFQDRLNSGQYQFTSWGWGADYPDPENFALLLYGPNRHPGPNTTGYRNPEYDRLFERMRTLPDGPERLRLIRQMRAIASEDCPLIYHSHWEGFGLTQPWLANFKPHPIALDTAKYLDVDGPMRARLQADWNRPNYWPLLGIALFLVAGSVPAAAVVCTRGRQGARRRRGAAVVVTEAGGRR